MAMCAEVSLLLKVLCCVDDQSCRDGKDLGRWLVKL